MFRCPVPANVQTACECRNRAAWFGKQRKCVKPEKITTDKARFSIIIIVLIGFLFLDQVIFSLSLLTCDQIRVQRSNGPEMTRRLMENC